MSSVDAAPFDLPGEGRAAALCLHGLTGTPYEVRPLGEALSTAGIRALGPALPGHNETPRRLAAVRREQWLGAARENLDRLRREHEVVFGVGLSMGGLVTLLLASEGAFEAAVVVGTPLRLAQPGAALVPVVRFVMPFMRKAVGSDIRDPEARGRHPSYESIPLAAVRQLQHLQREVRGRLGSVQTPLLVAHGAYDRTANPADSKEIVASVGSAEREHLILERSGHVVPVDHDGPALAEATVRFLRPRA
ncbi:MAG: alpha/beta fold hydrolase [Myxococcota bacterium]|nr:alpha/beta fold hydrolase [Myxococcota bacterium]